MNTNKAHISKENNKLPIPFAVEEGLQHERGHRIATCRSRSCALAGFLVVSEAFLVAVLAISEVPVVYVLQYDE